MERPAVHLRGAVVLLGRFPALSGVDLDVAAGEVVVVHGANGSGKTTLLRLCAGLQAPARGEAVVLGHDLTADRRGLRRQVGLLGHAGFLYDDLTIADNVRFAVRASGGDPATVPAALHRTGLTGRLPSTGVAALSAGQRRRAALAVLVARAPRLWLLDEPHAGLDPEGRDLLDDLVREAAAGGATILVASHDVDRSARIADRTLTMAGGALVADERRTADATVPAPVGSADAGPAAATTVPPAEVVGVA